MDQLERRLRDVLTSERRALDPSLVSLDRVHAGAARRHRRRVAVTAGGTAVAVLAAAGIGFALGGRDQGADPVNPLDSASATTNASEPPSPSQSPSPTPTATGPAWGDARVVSMTATSTRTIVVLGALGDTGACSPPDCIRLAESHDGGQTFSSLPVPGNARADGPSDLSATQVRFGSAQDGWLFGDGLWSTHDGGHTWHHLALGGPVLRLEAAAGTAWALVGDGSGGEMLWSSPVGNDDWRTVTGVRITAPGDLAVQGDRVTVVGAEASPAWSNASGRFKPVDNPCKPALRVELSASGGVWAKCATGTAAFVAAYPNGDRWIKVPLDTGQGAPPNSMVVGARTSSQALVWLGTGSPLFRLSTKGATTQVAAPPGTGISWMGFTTPDIGYAITCCSIQTLLRTDDGGDTWAEAGPG